LIDIFVGIHFIGVKKLGDSQIASPHIRRGSVTTSIPLSIGNGEGEEENSQLHPFSTSGERAGERGDCESCENGVLVNNTTDTNQVHTYIEFFQPLTGYLYF